MKFHSSLLTASFLLLLVAVASAVPEKEPVIKCQSQNDCMGKNAVCSGGFCTCSWGFNMIAGDCFLQEEHFIHVDEDILRSKRSPDQKKIEKLQKKLVKAQIKEAKKHGGVHVVPVIPATHVHHHSAIIHPPFARVPVVHVSRHRRTPGAASKIERKIVKAQVKRIAKKESKKVLKNNRHKRDSHHKKIEKLERKLVKEQHKQLKKDIKKGRVVPHYVAPVVYHPQPVYQATYHKKPKGFVAKAKSYIG